MEIWPAAYCDDCHKYGDEGFMVETTDKDLYLCRRHLFQLREMIDKLEDEHEEPKV